MCTAISMLQGHHFFGRTLDYERSFGEVVAIAPRRYPFSFTSGEKLTEHYAMIGTATVVDGYPLYYEATNEKGLSMAGLLFSGNAVYASATDDEHEVASFELIPWVLGRCTSVEEACVILRNVRITDQAFRADLPPSPLHWIVADKQCAVTLESLADGVHIYDNPMGVLTNNPPFSYHCLHLSEYMRLTDEIPSNDLYSDIALHPYSRGMGAIGLPGDWSSASRFVRAVFAKAHVAQGDTREAEIMQFFHVMRTVAVPCGAVTLPGGEQVMTRYTSCCDTEKGVYYCSTYENSAIFAVDMYAEDLTGSDILWYSFPRQPRFTVVNDARGGDPV